MPATIYRLVNEQGETTYIGSTIQEPPAKRQDFHPGFEEILTVPVAKRFKYEHEAIRTAFEDGHPLTNYQPKRSDNTVSVNFLLEQTDLNKLKERADQNGRSVASELRLMVKNVLRYQ